MIGIIIAVVFIAVFTVWVHYQLGRCPKCRSTRVRDCAGPRYAHDDADWHSICLDCGEVF
jgi:hypothetical protein